MKKVFLTLTALLLCLSLLPMCALAELDAGNAELAPEIEAMLPAFDSVIRAYAEYNPRDPEFFWDAIYLMAVNWNDGNPLATLDDDKAELILPRKLVQELATALFADYDDLLPVPQSMSASVMYDEAQDAYRFPLSDAGDTYTEIEDVATAGDGAIVVYANMKSYSEEDGILRRMRFELAPNAYADGIAEPTYLHSIISAQSEEAEG